MRKFFEQYSKRINYLNVLIIIINVLIIIRFLNVQVINNDNYKKNALNKGQREKTIYGERGKITDINGNSLALTISKYDFWINTNQTFEKDKIINLLSDNFNKPTEFYEQKINKKSNYVVLERDKLYQNCSKILNASEKPKGLRIEVKNDRFYPNSKLACHILGYVDRDGHGIYGIEENFNSILAGDTTRIKLYKGSNGQYYKKIESNKNYSNGFDISLTINNEFQKILQDEIEKISHQTKANAAHGIIIDPFTGDIIAMAAYPDYDPNNYSKYDIDNFRNRCISDSYEPGSTFKIVALSQVLESNKYSLTDSIYCEEGQMTLLNKKLLRDHEPHNYLSILDIFAHSSNIGTAKIAGEFSDLEFYRYCKNFGFGTITGIPLKSESKGVLRTIEDWSKTSKNYISIGQEISVTSLQIAMAYCSIANGGYLLKPNIINKISNNENIIFQKKIRPLRRNLKKDTSKNILKAMKKTIKYGTAKNINLNGFSIGGKTGTAQKFINGEYSPDQFISSFVSIFPIDKPQYVTLIAIDSPQYGYHWSNESAVPATKEIIKRIMIIDNMEKHIDPIKLSNKHVEKKSVKSYSEYNNTYTIKENINSSIKVPNLKGKTLKEAIRMSNEKGMTVIPKSIEGKVIWQSIKPGTLIDSNQVCNIELKK